MPDVSKSFEKTKQVFVTLNPVDSNESAANATDPAGSSANPAIASVSVFSQDGFVFKVAGVSAGVTIITFTVKNTKGDVLTATFEVTVTESLAVALRLIVSDPQNQ